MGLSPHWEKSPGGGDIAVLGGGGIPVPAGGGGGIPAPAGGGIPAPVGVATGTPAVVPVVGAVGEPILLPFMLYIMYLPWLYIVVAV